MMAVKSTTNTAADLLEFYPKANRDGLNITWAHAVNSKDELHLAVQGECNRL